MTTSTNSPTVTMKNNKAAIMSAYKDALARLNKLEDERFDPEADQKKEAEKSAIQEISDAGEWDVSSLFAETRKSIDGGLRVVQETLEGKLEQLKTADIACQAINKQLEELYGIKAEASSLAALVESKKALKAKLEKEHEEVMEANEDALSELKAEIVEERQASEELAKKRDGEWEYELARKKKEDEDKLRDELNSRRREWEEELYAAKKTLKEDQEALAKEKESLSADQERLANIETEIENRVKEEKARIEKQHHAVMGAMQKNFDADVKILNHENGMMRETVTDLKEQVTSLQEKLENAYAKIQGVANAALEAKGNANTNEQVQRAIASGSVGKKG